MSDSCAKNTATPATYCKYYFILTICVAAFRLDASKFVGETRRAVAERAENIGIWFKIMEMLAQIAVISNVRENTLLSDH